MPFDRAMTIKPSRIGDLSIELFSPDPTGVAKPFMQISIYVVMDDGEVKVRRIDLNDNITSQRLTSLNDLLSQLRAKSEAEILPVA